jgi:hypothetical protein
MERRKHPRIAHKSLYTIPITFSGEAKGTGTLYDLSPGGCKVDSRTTPPLGASLTLRLAVRINQSRSKSTRLSSDGPSRISILA